LTCLLLQPPQKLNLVRFRTGLAACTSQLGHKFSLIFSAARLGHVIQRVAEGLFGIQRLDRIEQRDRQFPQVIAVQRREELGKTRLSLVALMVPVALR
jgi:hypothetical protein